MGTFSKVIIIVDIDIWIDSSFEKYMLISYLRLAKL